MRKSQYANLITDGILQLTNSIIFNQIRYSIKLRKEQFRNLKSGITIFKVSKY